MSGASTVGFVRTVASAADARTVAAAQEDRRRNASQAHSATIAAAGTSESPAIASCVNAGMAMITTTAAAAPTSEPAVARQRAGGTRDAHDERDREAERQQPAGGEADAPCQSPEPALEHVEKRPPGRELPACTGSIEPPSAIRRDQSPNPNASQPW